LAPVHIVAPAGISGSRPVRKLRPHLQKLTPSKDRSVRPDMSGFFDNLSVSRDTESTCGLPDLLHQLDC
jgi:hypothetical protein